MGLVKLHLPNLIEGEKTRSCQNASVIIRMSLVGNLYLDGKMRYVPGLMSVFHCFVFSYACQSIITTQLLKPLVPPHVVIGLYRSTEIQIASIDPNHCWLYNRQWVKTTAARWF